jgi:hypothetical protein
MTQPDGTPPPPNQADPHAGSTPAQQPYPQPGYGAAPAPAYPESSWAQGYPQQGQQWSAATVGEPQGGQPSAPRAPLPLGPLAAVLGVLALVFSFFPWISPTVELGSAGELLGSQERSLLDSTLDDLYANAWDLRWATRSVLLAVFAAVLTMAAMVDRKLRGPWTLAGAVLAATAAAVFMIIQIVNRAGIYGRVLEVFSDLVNSDNQFTSTDGVQVGLGLRWGAIATAVVVFAQFVVLIALWLRSRQDEDGRQGTQPAGADGSSRIG